MHNIDFSRPCEDPNREVLRVGFEPSESGPAQSVSELE